MGRTTTSTGPSFLRRFWCVLVGGHHYISPYGTRDWTCTRCLHVNRPGDPT